MPLSESQRVELKKFLENQIGKPYVFGIENDGVQAPGAWDCSELVQGALAHIGIRFTDGARYQLHACKKLPEGTKEELGDLGFLVDPVGTPARHVVMVFDDLTVIEARGRPFSRVIVCEKKYWLNRPGFLCWYRPGVYGMD